MPPLPGREFSILLALRVTECCTRVPTHNSLFPLGTVTIITPTAGLKVCMEIGGWLWEDASQPMKLMNKFGKSKAALGLLKTKYIYVAENTRTHGVVLVPNNQTYC